MKLLKILLFLISYNFYSFSSDTENLFLKGNEHFQNKEYDKAIEIYEQLVDEGYEGTSLYFNLGNSYYRTGKLGYAILYYERALKLSPGDSDTEFNLSLANLRTVDKVESLPKFFLFDWWEGLLGFYSLSGWTIAVYIFYILLLGSIGFYFFSKSIFQQKILLITALVSFLLLILTSTLLFIKLNREINIENGVIIEQSVNVKLSPDDLSNDAFIIHEGLKVILEDEVNNWVRIRLLDGKVGWMPKENLRVI